MNVSKRLNGFYQNPKDKNKREFKDNNDDNIPYHKSSNMAYVKADHDSEETDCHSHITSRHVGQANQGDGWTEVTW